MEDKGKKEISIATKGAKTLLIGRIISMILSIVFVTIAAKVLTQSEYGNYSYWISLAGLFSIPIGTFAFTLSRFMAKHRADPDLQKEFQFQNLRIIVLIILIELVLWFLILRGDIEKFVFSLIGTAIAITYASIMGGRLNFGLMALYDIVTILSRISILFVLILMETTVTSEVLLAVFLASTLPIPIAVSLRSHISIFKKRDLGTKHLRRIFEFSIPVLISTAATTLLASGDIVIVGIMMGYQQAAIYAIAKTLMLPLTFLPYIYKQSLAPAVAASDSKKQSLLELKSAFRVTLSLSILMTFSIVIFSSQIIVLMFSDAYLPASILIPFLALAYLIRSTNSLLYSFWSGLGETKKISIVSTIAALIGFLLCILMIPILGLLGACLSLLICELIAMPFLVLMFINWRKNVTAFAYD